jgi:NADH-quinone oxidoreductase subunit A
MLFSLSNGSIDQYLPIALFFAIAVFLSVIIMIMPRILAPKVFNASKLTAYECGFEPFDQVRGKFDIKFYLVAMLFIIFDLEIAFLIPWAVNLKSIGAFGYYSMMFFLGLLTLGLVYEWKKGALEW